MKSYERRELVLRAAIRAARKPGGWAMLTRAVIACHAECSDGLVSKYLGDMQSARRRILQVAIDEKILEILAQSLAFSSGQTLIPSGLKQKALRTLSGK